ncbi:MAG TPA: response regulator [Pyrinomonadaceae bacterium]|jgi:two-component system NtrC family sensor kinase|nr:response regulator [Pyrinomonadaceae bacterium]
MSVSSIQPAKSFTLLIVDDDERARDFLQNTFESAQHQVKVAADAPTALRLLHREPCDLILLDIELPGIDGLALCRLLRAQEATRRLPIIVISAHDDEERKVSAFAAGADDFIVKPATRRELLSRVGTQIEAAQRERALVGSNRELGFLADLGRGLLVALEPLQVVRRVAGATYEAANAALCAAMLELPQPGDGEQATSAEDGAVAAASVAASSDASAACVFDREGSAEGGALIDQTKLRRWLATDPATSGRLEDPAEFFLRDETHRIEYVAPLRFEGRALGALIVAFDRAEDCGETEGRLIDAAAQQAALAARISSLYEAARASSASLAKEVERRTAEAEAQRRFTEAIIDTLPVSLYAVDRNHRIVAWNRNRELGGQGIPRGEALGRNIFDVLTRQRRDILEREFSRAFETGRMERIEQESIAEDGTAKHWLVSKVPMRVGGDEVSHVITVGEDITTRVEANRAVARTEKLAAVGRLAAGVVHEINNPLATIAACAEALETRVAEGAFGQSTEIEDLREYLSLIRSEAFRCKTITNGLLDFSRNRAGQHAPVELGEVLEAAARLLRHQKRSRNVEIVVDAAPDVAAVSGDAGQLQQAVIILAENAIDAMPQGGTLLLRARNEGAGVRVEVCDTGVGIPQENLARIFDPFFTTKDVGQGTGLGLAVCYGIVTEHGGRVAVDSVIGRGTTFTLVLPSLSEERLDGGRVS